MSEPRIYTFDTLRKSTIHFLNIFNNIHINKYDDEGEVTQVVKVPLKLAGKQKFYYWLYDRKHAKRFPMMAGAFKSLSPTIGDRGLNQKLNFISSTEDKIQTPVPYNINFELIIIHNYISEGNQILEQILPYFSPYAMTTINIPEAGIKFDMKVNLEGVSEDQEFNLPEDDYRTMSWILSFNALTFLFRPLQDVKLVDEIYLNFRNNNEGLMERHKITDEIIEIQTYEELHGLEND
jgi:hypothetical protein